MMKLADMQDLGSCAVMRWGSNPHARTRQFKSEPEGSRGSDLLFLWIARTLQNPGYTLKPREIYTVGNPGVWVTASASSTHMACTPHFSASALPSSRGRRNSAVERQSARPESAARTLTLRQ